MVSRSRLYNKEYEYLPQYSKELNYSSLNDIVFSIL